MRMLRMHRMQWIGSTCETALRSARARTIIFDNDLGRLLAPPLDRCAVENASSRLVERGVVRPHGADPKHSWHPAYPHSPSSVGPVSDTSRRSRRTRVLPRCPLPEFCDEPKFGIFQIWNEVRQVHYGEPISQWAIAKGSNRRAELVSGVSAVSAASAATLSDRWTRDCS